MNWLAITYIVAANVALFAWGDLRRKAWSRSLGAIAGMNIVGIREGRSSLRMELGTVLGIVREVRAYGDDGGLIWTFRTRTGEYV